MSLTKYESFQLEIQLHILSMLIIIASTNMAQPERDKALANLEGLKRTFDHITNLGF